MRLLVQIVLCMVAAGVASAGPFASNPKAKLQLVHPLSHAPAGMTVTPKGHYVISLHQYFRTADRVVIYKPGEREARPFPNRAISQGLPEAEVKLDAVQGLQCDKKGVVWMLDNGRRSETAPKIVAWDTKENVLHKVIMIPPEALRGTSFLNDLILDPEGDFIYVTDPAGGDDAALIVVNRETNLARRVLEGHSSVKPSGEPFSIDERPVEVRQLDGSIAYPQSGINPIAIDRKGDVLYFGPMRGKTLYRIKTKYLKMRAIGAAELGGRVEVHGAKPNCDGIAIDDKGNIYVSDLEAKGIGVIERKTGRYVPYVFDERFEWPDGLCFGTDSRLYFYTNQVHRSAPFNRGVDGTRQPFYIFKIKGLANGRFENG